MNKTNKQQVPKIRFENFDKIWGYSTLGNLTEYIKGFAFSSSEFSDSGIRVIRVSDLSNNKVSMNNAFVYINPAYLKTHDKYLLRKGDIIITTVGSKSEMRDSAVGRAISIDHDIKAFLNQNLVKIRALKNSNNGYLYNYLLLGRYRDYISTVERGNANQANITIADLWEYKVYHPDLKEQTQIGNFFQELDKLIELQTRSVESAEIYKKAMLQKMFPQKGEKVPRVRFEGFSGDWVTTYFKDVADVRRGLTYSPSDVVTDKKGIRVLRSSNIDEDTLIISDADVFVSEDAVKISYIKMNEILITAANGSSRLVGKHAIVNQDLQQAVHGGFMLAVSTSQPEFINSWMNGGQYKRMLQLVQGGNGAIGNLSRSMLEECRITLPCLKERTAIGNYFQKLDQNIATEKKKLEQYQTMKRAMLQRMFV